MDIPRGIVAACVLLSLVTVPAGAAVTRDVRVSVLAGPQNEPAIAVDPTDRRILLAGSNSLEEGITRVYESSDAGATWTTGSLYPLPANPGETCAAQPGVAIDTRGRQYYSFIRAAPCRPLEQSRQRLFVAARDGHGEPWDAPVLVSPLGTARADDKPALTVDTARTSPYEGRVYVAWTRVARNIRFHILSSYSDDGGLSWSKPVKVNTTGNDVTYVTLATSRNGTLYAAWEEAENYHLKITRSTNGGKSFERERIAAAFSIVTIPGCGSGIPLPALRLRCVRANPTLAVDRSDRRYRGRVYVSYTQTEFFGGQGARLTILDSSLRTLAGYPKTRLGVPVAEIRRAPRDQFLAYPVVDSSTGALWVCFYDTKGDAERKRTRFSCAASVDGGRRFSKPVAVASTWSDVTRPDSDERGYGSYEGLAAANGIAHPIWTDTRHQTSAQSTEIYTSRLRLRDVGLSPAPRARG